MKMSVFKEKPFDHLKRKTGEAFDQSIKDNWYIAREYVLDKLKDIAFRPDSKAHLEVVVKGDSPQMLSVVRQVALSAHYINFYEGDDFEQPQNRTVIFLVSDNPNIKSELKREEYLGNLPDYCKFVNQDSTIENNDSFLDIEIHIVKDNLETCDFVFSEDGFSAFRDSRGDAILGIDTRRAVYASRMYDLGDEINNIPSEDIHCAERYALALDVFQYEKLKKKPEPMFGNGIYEDMCKVKEKLSNIFCSDCFKSRAMSIQLMNNGSEINEWQLWKKNNECLSRSEHVRWVVEKLIMGYRPLNKKQHFDYENLYFDITKKKQFLKKMKKDPMNPAHIDICSYRELRRINPEDLKFDSFLMLAIPRILNKENEDEK